MTAAPERLVVLLADDDPNDTVLIRRAVHRLRSLSRLIEVTDGDQVVSYLNGEGLFVNRAEWPLPRLLILDQWMPRLSGLDVLRWVRSDPRFANLPVVVLSGALSMAQTDWMKTMRAAYCAKAFTVKDLTSGLEVAISSALQLIFETPSLATVPRLSSGIAPTNVGLRQKTQCSQYNPGAGFSVKRSV